MTPVPILSGLPAAPEKALEGQVRPRAAVGRVADAAGPLAAADFLAALDQAAKPVAGDTPDLPDRDQAATPFLDLFQAVDAQAGLEIPITVETIPQTETFKAEFVAPGPVEIAGGIFLETRPMPTTSLAPAPIIVMAGIENVAAPPAIEGVAPAQPAAPFAETSTALMLQRAAGNLSEFQPVASRTEGGTSSVEMANAPIEKAAAGKVNPVPATLTTETAPKVAVLPPTIAMPRLTTPETLAPIALSAGNPIVPTASADTVQPTAPPDAPRDLTGVSLRAPLTSGEVKETDKGETSKVATPPPDVRGRLALPPLSTAANTPLPTDRPTAPPVEAANLSGQDMSAPKVDTRTPSIPAIPVLESQGLLKTSVPDPAPNPEPNPNPNLGRDPRETGLGQAAPPKVQASVPDLATGQTQPPATAFAAAPQISEPLHRAPDIRAGQPAPLAAPQSPDAPVLIPTNATAPQPLNAEPLPSTLVDSAQLDLPFQPLVKSDGSPALNAPQLPPVTPKSVAIQIAQAASTDGGRAVEIALDPVELGKVRLTLHSSETGINVQIQADRPETIDLMRRNAHLLEAEFESIGYQNIGFDFSQNQQNPMSETPEDQSNWQGDRTMPLDDAPTGQPNYAMAPPVSGGLDLRL
jgi:flagellar hook-length control protein FliK